MLNFFEQPWTLTVAAVLALLVILQFRSIFPEKYHWWQLLVPVLLAGAAFGLDALVQTDLEKINVLINTGVKAVQQEDCEAIDRITSNNYSDSYHSTKYQLLAHCRRELPRFLIEKNRKTGLLIDISAPKATATLFMMTTFAQNSYITQNYKSFIMVKAKLYFQKQPDNTWLISRVEVLELDRQPANWSNIR